MIREEPSDPNSKEYNAQIMTATYFTLQKHLLNSNWLAVNNPLNRVNKSDFKALFPLVDLSLIFPGGEPLISVVQSSLINDWLEADYPLTDAYSIKLLKRYPTENQRWINAKIEEWVISQQRGAYRCYFTRMNGDQIDTDHTLTSVPPKSITNQDLPYLAANMRYITDIVDTYPSHFFPPVLITSPSVSNYLI